MTNTIDALRPQDVDYGAKKNRTLLQSLSSVHLFTAPIADGDRHLVLSPILNTASDVHPACNASLRKSEEPAAPWVVKQSTFENQRSRKADDEERYITREAELMESSVERTASTRSPQNYVLRDNFGRAINRPGLSAVPSSGCKSEESLEPIDEFPPALYINLSIMWSWKMPIMRRARCLMGAFRKIFNGITEIYG